MIRKAIIVLLTLGAVGTALLLVVSFTGHYKNVDWLPPSGLPGWERGWLKTIGDIDDTSFFTIDASKGRLALGYFTKVEPSIFVPRKAFGLPGLLVKKQTVFPASTVAFRREQMLLHALQVPLWLLLPLFAAYPVAAFIRGPLRRRRRRKRGLCVRCGYSLTGNVTGVCPECGWAIR